ncbi:hypothetical protein Droror1_Dr00027863 [Drosera rotundifolia]
MASNETSTRGELERGRGLLEQGPAFDGWDSCWVCDLLRVWILMVAVLFWVCPGFGFTAGWVNSMEEFGVLVFKILSRAVVWHPVSICLLPAVDRYAANFSSFPGQCDGEMDEDMSRLKTIAVGLLSEIGCNGVTLSEDINYEMCRYDATELHAVAAFIGIASQKIIKLITMQFIPMRGTFIFDGIDHKS